MRLLPQDGDKGVVAVVYLMPEAVLRMRDVFGMDELKAMHSCSRGLPLSVPGSHFSSALLDRGREGQATR